MVNNSLIQPRGLSAWHCRPSPAPRRRRKFNRDLRGALAECRALLITLSIYCCAAPHQDRVPMDRRPALFGASFVARHGNELAWDSQPKRQVIPKIRLLSWGGSKRRCSSQPRSYGGNMLGIGSGSFDPETLVILETAFDEAWITLKTNGSANIRPDELARRICHLAMEGELIWIRSPV